MKVTFFPRNDYPNAIVVCDNRWGKSMTYCENSDTLQDGLFIPIIKLAFKYSIKLGCFISKTWNNSIHCKNLKDNGIIDFDLYSCYQGNNTQESFNGYIDNENSWFLENIGKIPSCFSFSGSDQSYAALGAQKMIAGRSNEWNTFGNPYTWNGISFNSRTILGNPQITYNRIEQMKHLMSIRWCDEVRSGNYTPEEAISNLVEDVQVTKEKGGFYNAFAHWHDVITGGYKVSLNNYENYFSQIANPDIHFCSFGEAMEYAIARTILKRVVMYSPIDNKEVLRIVADYNNDYEPKINKKCLNTNLSAIVDLSDTHLSGKFIHLKFGNFIKIDNDKYIIDLPSPNNSIFSYQEISESNIDESLNTNKPVLTKEEKVVYCDQYVNWVVFSGNDIIDYKYNSNIVELSSSNYNVGVINKYGKTNYI